MGCCSPSATRGVCSCADIHGVRVGSSAGINDAFLLLKQQDVRLTRREINAIMFQVDQADPMGRA